jgi:taurine transport system permease protein
MRSDQDQIRNPAKVSLASRRSGRTRSTQAWRPLATRFRRLGLVLLGIGLGMVVWELVSVLMGSDILMPGPVATAKALIDYIAQPFPAQGFTIWQHAIFSLRRILIGYAAGVGVGILVGSGMVVFPVIRGMLDPLVEAGRVLPMLAFIPMLIIWFGIDDLPKIVVIAVVVAPIMVISTVAALDQFPNEMFNAARCLGASDTYALLHVRIRGSAPAIVTGMRVCMGAAWASLVGAELITATSGLGYLVLQAG